MFRTWCIKSLKKNSKSKETVIKYPICGLKSKCWIHIFSNVLLICCIPKSLNCPKSAHPIAYIVKYQSREEDHLWGKYCKSVKERKEGEKIKFLQSQDVPSIVGTDVFTLIWCICKFWKYTFVGPQGTKRKIRHEIIFVLLKLDFFGTDC